MSKLKISNIVRHQLPEFIRSNPDYENFMLFLEAYYDFLDQSQKRDIESLRDIDLSLNDFITQFRKEFNYTNTYSGNEALFLRHVKQLYSSKGSESSYKLLFKLLFNKNVDLIYPAESILIPSNGKWIQENFLFAEITSGSVDNLVGKEVNFVGSKTVKAFVEKVKQYSGSIYKIFVSKNYQTKDIEVGSTFNSNSVIGTVKPTITGFKIKSAGSRFQVGQLFEIAQGSIGGTTAKVTRVGDSGEIIGLQIIKHGINYAGNFSKYLNWTPDLTTNSDFELGDIHWTKTASFSIENDPSKAFRGSWVVKRDNTLSGQTIRGAVYTLCKEGEIYKATARIRMEASATNGSNFVRLAGYNGSGVETIIASGNNILPNISYNGKYRLSTVTGTIPAGIIRVRAEIVGTGTIGICYYDDVSMRNLSSFDPSRYGSDADVEFTVGAVASNPGYFANNDGFISDAIYIQDSKYHQSYS